MTNTESLFSLISCFNEKLTSDESTTVVGDFNRVQWICDCEKNTYNNAAIDKIREASKLYPRVNIIIDEINQYADNRIKFSLKFGADDFFYEDIVHFKKCILADKKFPESELYIFKEKLYQIDVKNIQEKLKPIQDAFNNINCILSSFKKLAHYEGKNDEIVFIDPSEKSTLTITISTDTSEIQEIPSILDTQIEHHTLSCLINDKDEENGFFFKERAIFRTSLFEFFKNKDIDLSNTEQTTIMLLQKFSDFEKLYSSNYEAYISGISLDKLKLELAQEQLKFSDQTAKILSDITNKMIAFPVMTGLITLIRINLTNTSFGILLIFLTTLILLLSIWNQDVQLGTIEQAQEISFNNIKQKIIQNSQEKATNLLSKELSKLLNKLKFSLLLARCTLFSYIIIILILNIVINPEFASLTQNFF